MSLPPGFSPGKFHPNTMKRTGHTDADIQRDVRTAVEQMVKEEKTGDLAEIRDVLHAMLYTEFTQQESARQAGGQAPAGGKFEAVFHKDGVAVGRTGEESVKVGTAGEEKKKKKKKKPKKKKTTSHAADGVNAPTVLQPLELPPTKAWERGSDVHRTGNTDAAIQRDSRRAIQSMIQGDENSPIAKHREQAEQALAAQWRERERAFRAGEITAEQASRGAFRAAVVGDTVTFDAVYEDKNPDEYGACMAKEQKKKIRRQRKRRSESALRADEAALRDTYVTLHEHAYGKPWCLIMAIGEGDGVLEFAAGASKGISTAKTISEEQAKMAQKTTGNWRIGRKD